MSRAAAFRFLCHCLSDDATASSPTALRRSAEDPSFNWETFVAIAAETRVAPAVLSVLRSKDLIAAVPPDVVDFFDGMAILNQQRNEQLMHEALELAGVLNEIDVVPIFLKGAANLLSGLYPELAQRIMLDLDVLVPTDRLSDCTERLRAAGFKDLLTDWDFSGHHHAPPLGRRGRLAAVELHSEPLDLPYRWLLPAAEVSRAAVVVERGAVKLALPSGRCRVVQTVAHAELADQAYLYGQLPLRELLDLARLHALYGQDINWRALAERFAACGFATALEFHVLAAQCLLGVPIDPSIRVTATTRALYRRALWQLDHPTWSRLGARVLRPYVLLRRSLSDAVLRRRLLRNLGNGAWYRRQWRMLRR